ncbi:MAG: aryl-sulfate sulfotransferase, partial [Bacteroidetes bacterium]|nr:aryl-sulfate sulfotransferase [Bacteroidota bacterium]
VSRGVEYAVDQNAKTATMVWQYRHTPDVYTPTRGSVQMLPNGNRVIGWGSAPFVGIGKTMITELSPQDSVLFEMECNDKMPSYRAQKFVWNSHRTPAADVQLAELLPGNTYHFNRGDTVRTGVSITLTDATFGYNGVRVRRYAFAPVNVSFPMNDPVTAAMRWEISQSGITSFTAEVRFDSTILKDAGDRKKLVVYHREFEGSGMFFPLASVYDSVAKTLTATTTKFGEFIVGVPELVTVVPPAPNAVLPLNGALVNQTEPLLIRWGTVGHVTGYLLQVTADTNGMTYLINDPSLKSSYIVWNGYSNGTTYYWRVKVANEAGSSPWSSWSSFTMSPVYLSVTAPAAGQKLTFNATTVLTYRNNFQERVHLRLYRNGVLALKIKDSTENTGRYVWKVPAAGLTADSTYTLRVISVLDSTLAAVSAPFTIANPVSVAGESGPVRGFSLAQNYPNPFNPTTMLEFTVPGPGAASTATLEVFNPLGQRIALLWNGPAESGRSHRVTFHAAGLPAGIYLARLTSGGMTGVRKLVLVK